MTCNLLIVYNRISLKLLTLLSPPVGWLDPWPQSRRYISVVSTDFWLTLPRTTQMLNMQASVITSLTCRFS
jgi:hypothetical protein